MNEETETKRNLRFECLKLAHHMNWAYHHEYGSQSYRDKVLSDAALLAEFMSEDS